MMFSSLKTILNTFPSSNSGERVHFFNHKSHIYCGMSTISHKLGIFGFQSERCRHPFNLILKPAHHGYNYNHSDNILIAKEVQYEKDNKKRTQSKELC